MKRAAMIVVDAVGAFLADDGWAVASHIALSTLTALFPFVIFLTAVASFVGSQSLADEAARLLVGLWPAGVAKPIAGELRQVLVGPRAGLLTFSAALALYFSSSAIEALRTGLNRAYDCEERRPWWVLRLHSIAFTAVASIALLALAFFVVLAPLVWSNMVAYAPAIAPWRQVFTVARLAFVTLAFAGALVSAHLWLPAARRPFSEVAPGVAFSLVAGVGFGELFAAYLSEFARNYVATYAGLASAMVALLYLYFLAAIFVFGGELNVAILRTRLARSGRAPLS